MAPLDVAVTMAPREHVSQVAAGLVALEATGAVRITSVDARPPSEAWPDMAAVELCTGRKILIDMADNGVLAPTDLTGPSLLYVKRSYDEAVVGASDRPETVIPWGLNMGVPVADRRFGFRTDLVPRRRLRPLDARDLEGTPDDGDGAIVCLTRTWNPGQMPEETFEDVSKLNEGRAAVVRRLRAEFGERFVGGFLDSDHARRAFPDLICDRATLDRAAYLKTMKRSSVAVATTGLHRSIGWRLAEYVAASRAIVSEPLHYVVPGFELERHYLQFRDPNGAVAAVDRLLTDVNLARSMRVANYEHFQFGGKPDRLVLRALVEALKLIAAGR